MILLGHKGKSAKAEPYLLDAEILRQHVLVTGGPTSGKTNTCLQIIDQLAENDIPFLVIETQGKQYRKAQAQNDPVRTLSICDDTRESLRFNPLRTAPHVRILAHIQAIVSLTSASFNLSVTSSKVLEKALYNVYTNHGWNLFRNKNDRLRQSDIDDDNQYPAEAYPTFLELLEYVNSVTFSSLLSGPPPQELVRALDSLVSASKGAVFNTKAALPGSFHEDRRLVIECDAIADMRDKCFLVGLLLLSVFEYYQGKDTPKSIQKVIVIDDAVHTTYLMGLPGRRVGDDQKEDRWIPLAATLSNLRRVGVGTIVSFQASSKLSSDFLALFGTRVFHQVDVQQARQLVTFLPQPPTEKDLYQCTAGDGWVIDRDHNTSKIKVPLKELAKSVAFLSTRVKPACTVRYSGCSSCTNGCDDNIFTRAREVAESQTFRTIYTDYFLSCQKDLTQLVHFRGRLVGELQSQIGHKTANIIDLSWCTICQATEWYFDKLSRDHGWSYIDLAEQKERWFSMLRPAFLPDWPTRRINIDDLRQWRSDFWTLKERDQGPLPLCGECETKCRWGCDVSEILNDPRNENDFFKSLANETDSLSESAAWFCWLLSERVMGEADIDLAYCFAAHFLVRANLSVDAQIVFAHKTRAKLEETKRRYEESGRESLWKDPTTSNEEAERERRRKQRRERRKQRGDDDNPPPLRPVP